MKFDAPNHRTPRQSVMTAPSPNFSTAEIKLNLFSTNFKIRPRKMSRIEGASLFSKLHFLFGIKVIRLVNALKGREIGVEDLDALGDHESCEKLESAFSGKYAQLKNEGRSGVWMVGLMLIELFRSDVKFQFFWQLMYGLAKITTSFFLQQLIRYVQDPEKTVTQTYFQSIGLFLSFLLAVYAMHQFNFNLSYVLNKIKTGFMAMIFRKSLRLSHHAIHLMSLGKIVNFNATDLNNFERIHLLISLVLAPVILLCGCGLLFHFWGVNCFIGIGYMALLWPIQYRTSISSREIRMNRSKQTDDRIEGVIEGIQGISTIKYYNWDKSFISKMMNIRFFELEKLKSFNYRECFTRAFVFSSHWVSSFLIYVLCVVRGGELKGYLMFPTIYLMTALRQICVSNTYSGFAFLEEFILAARKINLIMGLSEVEEKGAPIEPLKAENTAEFENFNAFRINSNLEHDVPTSGPFAHLASKNKGVYEPVLQNINLNIKRGNLVAVIGDSGSGKSSFLLSFTNEFAKTTGTLRFQEFYTYVAQETVFFPGTLKDCIVFGRPYDEELFWKVLETCCLKDEVKALPNQEMTEIIEKGMNLSEGQRARVSLARAIYSDAEVYLLDECLSNLSMKVAKSIFKNCIQGLLKDKTVIMATNLLNLAKYANQIVVMDMGEIVAHGSYDELIENDENMKFISALKKLPKFEPTTNLKRASVQRLASGFADNVSLTKMPKPDDDKKKGISQIIATEPDMGLYIKDARVDEWKVTVSIYWKYLKTIFRWKLMLPAALLFAGTESISWLYTLFCAKWRFKEWDNETSYIVIGGMTLLSIPLSLMKYFFYFNRALNASNKFHNKLLARVFESPMKFFDRNPSGRIISRFTNDIGVMDKFLTVSILEVLDGFFSFWITVFALWTKQVEVFITFAILVVLCGMVVAWSYKAVAQTRGLELTTRSPMYSLFMLGVRGLGVIRVHGQMEDVNRIFCRKADDYSKANLAYMTSVRFMSFLMDYLIELVVIGTFAIFMGSKDNPLSSGFFVNFLGNFSSTMQWILRDTIKLHLLMASAARVINYCINTKGKKQDESGNLEFKEGEKDESKGKIDINHVQMKYDEEGEFVIQDLSVKIQPGEKIAVFGNTKGGGTTLVGLLSRMYPYHKTHTGKSYIKIDGTDINDVKLSSLRESVTVIPQTSVLFKDTIRNNLDPWKEYSDDEIWEAIDFVGLYDVVDSLEHKLNTKLSNGCHIFSLGQQQLMCLARGVLKNGRVFIQDEATSHLDFVSEQDIQKRLLRRYEDTTVINITHRLLTISNYDKVMTIQNGEAIEFDEPYKLLVDRIGDIEITRKKGVFALAVINMGKKAASEILRNAMVTYYDRHGLMLPHDENPIISHRFFPDDSFSMAEEKFTGKTPRFPPRSAVLEGTNLGAQTRRLGSRAGSRELGADTRRSSKRESRRRSRRDIREVYDEDNLNIPREHRRKLVVPNFMIKKIQFDRCELTEDTLKISPYLDTYRFFNDRNNMSYDRDRTFFAILDDKNMSNHNLDRLNISNTYNNGNMSNYDLGKNMSNLDIAKNMSNYDLGKNMSNYNIDRNNLSNTYNLDP